MEIKTKPYGVVEINPEEIITFEQGLPGFEDKKKFILLGNPETNDILVWLQSIEDKNLAFVVIQPKFFKSNYQPKINIAELEDLNIKDEADLLIYAIVVVPQDLKKMTANLQAPIVVNVKNNRGKQLILNDNKYLIKESIFA
jgi:flagellar assembly factor FliW